MEEKGFSTTVLTPTWEFHRAVGSPRTASIAYPYGRVLGEAGDRKGQRKVLLAALDMLETASGPGTVRHLPFRWPETPKETHWHPPEMSPIIADNLAAIKQARKGG